MASADFDKLNDRLQGTSTIFLAVVSIILLAFWYFAYGTDVIYLPLAVIMAAFLVQYFFIRPRMEKTLDGLKEGKK